MLKTCRRTQIGSNRVRREPVGKSAPDRAVFQLVFRLAKPQTNTANSWHNYNWMPR